MLPEIVLSINPTYYCNMSCEWCYLTPAQLADKGKVDLDVLRERLEDISNHYTISHIDVYGGEVTLLPKWYQRSFMNLIESFNQTSINVVTNYTAPNSPILTEYDTELSVSYDHVARPNHGTVYENLLLAPVPVVILTLVSREFLDTVDIDEYVRSLSVLQNLVSVDIKPYSSNQSNDHAVSYLEYEKVVKQIIDHPDRRFHLTNVDQIREVLSGNHNAYSDNHLYITPLGDLSVLDFDEHDREYFRKVGTIEEYREWTRREVALTDTGMCVNCKYRGGCLSEHIRVVTDMSESCNGFFNLLEAYNGIHVS